MTNSQNYTLEEVIPFLKMDQLQISVAAMARQEPISASDSLTESDIWFIVLADLLERLKFLQPAQRTLILATITGPVNKLVFPPISPADDEKRPIVMITFADGVFCSWTNNPGWLDLKTGAAVEKLPAWPIESLAYNLSRLVTDLLRKITQAKENGKNKRKAHKQNAPAE